MPNSSSSLPMRKSAASKADPRHTRRLFSRPRPASTNFSALNNSKPVYNSNRPRLSFRYSSSLAPSSRRRVFARFTNSSRRSSAHPSVSAKQQAPLFSPRQSTAPSSTTTTTTTTTTNTTTTKPFSPQSSPSVPEHHHVYTAAPLRIAADSLIPSNCSPSSSVNSATVSPLIDMEASEVSDDVSNEAPKSRRALSSLNKCVPTHTAAHNPDTTPLTTLSSHASNPQIKLCNVGEEETSVPDAPSGYAYNPASNPALDLIRQYNNELLHSNHLLKQRNVELNNLNCALRDRVSKSGEQVQTLTRQLQRTRAGLNREIGELHHQLAQQKILATDARPTAVNTLVQTQTDVVTKPLAADLCNSHHQRQFSRTRSTHNVQEQGFRRRNNVANRALDVRSPVRSASTSSRTRVINATSVLQSGVEAESDVAPPQTLARRNLIRRSFIAHIHASRYGSAHIAWSKFLGGDSSVVGLAQFSNCVRSLAVAAEATDGDLRLLMQEVCGIAISESSIVTRMMLTRFYRSTMNEDT